MHTDDAVTSRTLAAFCFWLQREGLVDGVAVAVALGLFQAHNNLPDSSDWQEGDYRFPPSEGLHRATLIQQAKLDREVARVRDAR